MRIRPQLSGDFKSAVGCQSPESWTNKHCVHCVPALLLPLRQRTHRNLSVGRITKLNSQEKPRLRRGKCRLPERNGHHRKPPRVFLAIRPMRWRHQNYNSVLSLALKQCYGGAVFTKVSATGSSALVWSFPSAHSNRAWELRLPAGSTWRHWPRLVCYPAQTAIRPWECRAVVLCPRENRRCVANGFINCRNESTATPR